MQRFLMSLLVILLSVTSSYAIPRFQDLKDGTMWDSTTNLIWPKNNCLGSKYWYDWDSTISSFASGQCGVSDNSKPGDWRVPNSGELLTLVPASNSNTFGFSNPIGLNWSFYWTNYPHFRLNSTTLATNLIDLETGNIVQFYTKYITDNGSILPYGNSCYGLPVKNGQQGSFGSCGALTLATKGQFTSPLNIGSTQSVKYSATNFWQNPVTIGQATLTSSSVGYSITWDNCSNNTILPGENCTIELLIQPTVIGTLNTNLSVPNEAICGQTNSIIAQPSVTAIATISGTITDSSTGDRLSTTTVTLSTGETTQADANGNYIFNPAPTSNTRSVTFSKAGYGSTTTSNVTTSASVGAIINAHLTPTGLFNILGTSFAPQQSIPFSGQVKITGGTGPYTFSIVSGSLPNGLALNSSNGVLSGTATVVGSFPITVRVTDSGTGLAELGGTIEVQAPLTFTTITPITSGTINTVYTSSISATGGKTPYSYAITGGVLPTGLILNTTTGAITGTPTTVLNSVITVTVTDALARTKSDTFMLGVGNLLGITPTRMNDGIVGSAYNGPAPTGSNIVGQPTWGIAAGSSLPAGLSIDAATGAISGTPTTALNKTVKLSLKDGIARTITKDVTFNVVPVLQISAVSLPDGFLNYAYSTTASASGGLAPYSYSLGGSLIAGMTFNTLTGTISGKPTAIGLTNITITATDATWPTPQTTTSNYSLRVNTQATLSITKAGTGSGGVTANSGAIVWAGNIGTVGYNGGTNVVLTAAPNADSVFTGWTGACTGTGTCSVTMNAAKSVTATFTYMPPVNGTCGSSNGTALTAKPSSNLCSAGTATNVTGTGPWSWSCTGQFTGTTAACSASLQSYSVTFASGGNGTLTGTVNQTVNYNASATAVTAVPTPGYHFVNWTGTGGFVTTTSNPLTVANVTSAKTITANFAINTFAVNFTSGGNGTLTGTVNQTINYNASATAITSVPATGYHFVNWTGTGGFVTSTANPLTVTNVTAAQTITANFTINPTNGACGSSNGTAFRLAPTVNLCSAGVESSVTNTSAWNWSCVGLNSGTTATCSAAIDIIDPTLTISTLANNAITNNPTLNISGSVSDTNGITGLTVNNVPVTITNGGFSYAFALQAGSNVITTIATDIPGNQTTDTRIITLDQTAPTLTVTAPTDNSKTAQPLTTITGTINETSTVTVKVNAGTPQSASLTGTVYSATANLTTGLNTITITATDLATNTSSVVRSVTYDNTNPSLSITSPNQDITTALGSVTISGTVSDTITTAVVTITADGQTYTPAIAQDGSFTQSIPLPTDKTYAVIATATDQAGNSTTVQRNIIKATPLTQPTLSDALKVLQTVFGITTLTDSEKIRFDVAPFASNGTPLGNGIIDSADVIAILRRSIGIGTW